MSSQNLYCRAVLAEIKKTQVTYLEGSYFILSVYTKMIPVWVGKVQQRGKYMLYPIMLSPPEDSTCVHWLCWIISVTAMNTLTVKLLEVLCSLANIMTE